MDRQTKEMLEILKEYLDEVETNHQGWENVFRIFMLTYVKLTELSAHLSPDMGQKGLLMHILKLQEHLGAYLILSKRQRIKTSIAILLLRSEHNIKCWRVS